MRLASFDVLYDMAASRKGGADAFEATLRTPKSPEELARIADDRWLSAMSKSVFQSGFSWKVVDAKWPRFEEVFAGFDVGRMSMMSDDDLHDYLRADGIIRHAKKILSIRGNAVFLRDLAAEQGSAGRAIGGWPKEDFSGLLWLLKRQGSRLGGTTGMYCLRAAGVDSFVLSRDVVRALIREGVVEKEPGSKRDLDRVQAAFNQWSAESGRPLMQISRVLACSIE
ncbi:MAG: 3-methyladenine DNA glycosylase [Rhizobiales bacterium]|nr:3-methyladenine DNA glycosylase [Hyphomicrobiales bacterium]